MEGDFIRINKTLRPLSWVYGLIVRTRNLMFETGILKTRTFDVPIISVGNITVGGSGKTPHVEYLIRLLMKDFNVAVLSRGYKRKSTGFILADANSTARDIGDEPYQMKRKFEQVTVAVDKNRCHGIDMLEECGVKPEVVLLDDAFQHRYVKPGINILLVDYHRLIIYDEMLPSGRLREPKEGKNRADIVIVTKCPKEMKPIDYRVINYGGLEPIFNGAPKRMEELVNENVLLLTGIASPQQMVHDLSPQCGHLQPLSFSDHHHFDAKDVQQINDTFATMEGPKCIVTTEKDATRLEGLEGLSDEVKASIYSLPITIQFLQEQQESFNNYITDYVRKNSRNSILVERKDDNKPQDSNYSGNRSRTISFRDN